LAAERDARQRTEQRLAEAPKNGQKAEQRHWVTGAAQEPREPPPQAPRRRGRPRKTPSMAVDSALPDPSLDPIVEAAANKALVADLKSLYRSPTAVKPEPSDAPKPLQHRRRGRPPKVHQPEAEVVQWWLPGWQERLR
jgi:hypothetical protein